MRSKRCTCLIVDKLFYITVVGTDKECSVDFLDKVDYLTDALVDYFNCLNSCFNNAGVAYHIRVCKVADDNIIYSISVLVLGCDCLA